MTIDVNASLIADGKIDETDSRAAQTGVNAVEETAAAPLETVRADDKKTSAPVALEHRAMDMAPDSFDESARTVDAVLSTGAIVRRRDWRDGEYDEALDMAPRSIRMGRLNGGAPVLDSHDYYSGTRAVVGAIVPGSAVAGSGMLRATIKFSRSLDGERVMQDVKDGILRRISIGYITHRYEVDDTASPPLRRAVDWEPHEASIVVIPADPTAGFRGLDPRPAPRKDNSMDPAETLETRAAPPPATPAIDQRAIDAAVAAEMERRDQIAEVARKLGLDGSFVADHIARNSTLDQARASAIDEKAKAEAAAGPAGHAGSEWEFREGDRTLRHDRASFGMPVILPAERLKTPEPGQRAAQMVFCVAAGKRLGVSPIEISRVRYGADSFSTRALQASIGSTGGFQIPIELSSEIIEFLRARTVVRKACPSSRQISLPRGNLTIGRQNTGATVGYIGEGQSTAYTQESFGEIVLAAKKAKALVPISNDLIRFAQSSADMIVRDDLVRQLAVLEDQNFLRGSGSAWGPKGMRYLASPANILTATLSYSVTTAIADLSSMVNALENAFVPMTNPYWFWSQKTKNYLYDARDSVGGFLFRTEMDQGRFRGYPFAWTQNIPQNLGSSANQSEVYLVDMDEFLIGDVPGLMIDASQEASYSSDGSTLTNSAFDRDETVIRIIAEHDCNIKHTAAACCLTAVPWGN